MSSNSNVVVESASLSPDRCIKSSTEITMAVFTASLQKYTLKSRASKAEIIVSVYFGSSIKIGYGNWKRMYSFLRATFEKVPKVAVLPLFIIAEACMIHQGLFLQINERNGRW